MIFAMAHFQKYCVRQKSSGVSVCFFVIKKMRQLFAELVLSLCFC